MTLTSDRLATEVTGAPRRPRLGRLAHPDVVVVALLALVAIVQSPGRTSFDTKLDLVVDPIAFLGRALDAWDPEGGFGQVQNQAYGYLWPMGPFFAIGDVLGLSPWFVQGLWMALLLAGAYLGFRRLASALGIGLVGAVGGAVVYAVSPRMLTVLGPISAEALPVALVPWMLLPLVREAVSGRSLRRTAFLSALAVFAMGAANAALTIAVLPLAVLWILLQCRDRWRLLVWWCMFVGLFSVWWAVPLLVQGAFAPPFLDIIETAAVTTGVVTPAAALRGTTHWVAYLVRDGLPWWPAGFDLAVDDLLVIATSALAAVGLVGLCLRRVRGGPVWALSLVLGLVLLSTGSGADPGSPFRDIWHDLLDGPLVPFRNVHKFDVLVRLPLCVGIAVAAAWAASAWPRRTGSTDAARPRASMGEAGRPWLRVGAAGLGSLVLITALVVSASPFLSRDLRPGPTWEGAVPEYWEDAAAFVEQQQTRTLLLPGSSFGEYQWGRTVDEPLQPLAGAPWAADNGLPLGAFGTARLLDAVNRHVEIGRSSPALADLLARSGIGFVLVRNDLDTAATGAPRPALVHAAIEESPGLTLVASFGPLVGGGSSGPSSTTDYAFDPAFPAIEVFRVDRPVVAADLTPVGAVQEVTGGSESLLALLESSLIEPDEPVRLSVDVAAEASRREIAPGESFARPVVLTDGLRLRERGLGRVQGSLSATRAPDDPPRVDRRAVDIHGSPPDGFQTFAELAGIRSVHASSSQAYADSLPAVDTARLPFAAVDGSQDTWWQSSNFGGPVGQWVDVGLNQPVRGGRVVIDLVESLAVGPRVAKVELDAGGEAVQADVPAGGRVSIPLPDVSVSNLRLTVLGVDGPAGNGFVGVREILVPGTSVTRPLLLPRIPGPVRGIDLSIDTLPRSACLQLDGQTRCDPSLLRGTEEVRGIDRLVDLDRAFAGSWSAFGVVRDGPTAAALFDPLRTGIRARASSWLAEDVLVRPSAAVDGRRETAWVAARGDAVPTLDLDLGEVRTVSALRIRNGDQPAVSRPTRVRVTTDSGVVVAALDLAGTVLLPSGTDTSSIRIEVLDWTRLISRESSSGFGFEAAVGISEVEVTGAEDLVYEPDLEATTGASCGLGPVVQVDGRAVDTEVRTTLGAVLRREAAEIRPCQDEPSTAEAADDVAGQLDDGDLTEVDLAPGRHRLTISSTPLILPSRFTATAAAARRDVERDRVLTVVDVDAVHRAFDVGPGGASVLRIAESANSGWVADLDGRRLDPVMLDGWQQGFVVPEGDGGRVSVRYAPDSVHKAGLAAGAALVALGLALGLRRDRGRRVRDPLHDRRLATWLLVTLLVVTGFIVCGVLGAVVAVAVMTVRRAVGWLGATGAGLLVAASLVAWAWSSEGSVPASGSTVVTLLSLAAVLWAAEVCLGDRRPDGGGADRPAQPRTTVAGAGGPEASTTTRA